MEIGSTQIASAEIEATIIRADGTIEHLGVIDSYQRSRWRTFLHWLLDRQHHTH